MEAFVWDLYSIMDGFMYGLMGDIASSEYHLPAGRFKIPT